MDDMRFDPVIRQDPSHTLHMGLPDECEDIRMILLKSDQRIGHVQIPFIDESFLQPREFLSDLEDHGTVRWSAPPEVEAQLAARV